MSGKLEAIDLIIGFIKEHEEHLIDVIDRLEKILSIAKVQNESDSATIRRGAHEGDMLRRLLEGDGT